VTEPDFLRATRASYDAVAADYAGRFHDELMARPLDRTVLAGFAELVRSAGLGPVAEVGCGAGRTTAHLSDLGLEVFGIDLSAQMIAMARLSHPGLRFDVGSMLALDLADAALGGLLAYYSTIHVPYDRLPGVFAEFCRVLAPGGYLLLAFQAGDETVRRTEALGHAVSLDFHRRQPDRVAALLAQAGLPTRARLLREPDEDGPFPESTPQARPGPQDNVECPGHQAVIVTPRRAAPNPRGHIGGASRPRHPDRLAGASFHRPGPARSRHRQV
jgi:SAM-dependent methyltransferase